MTSLPQQQPSGQAPYLDPLPGIIPFGSICIMSGGSGVGKTTLLVSWCRQWLDGGKILGVQSNRPTGLYYLAVDRPWHPTYADLFTVAGITSDELTYYTLLDDPTYDPRRLADPKHYSPFQHLQDSLDKLGPCAGSTAFIEPIAPLFMHGDQNTGRDVAITLHWLRRMQTRYACTFLCTGNVKKLMKTEDFTRVQDRISGSNAFLAYADTQFNFAENASNPKVRTLSWVPRSGPPGEEQFIFDPEGRLVRFDGLRDKSLVAEEDRPTQVLKLIPEDTSITRRDLLKRASSQLKTPLGTLKRDLKELLDDGRIVQEGRGRYRKRKLS